MDANLYVSGTHNLKPLRRVANELFEPKKIDLIEIDRNDDINAERSPDTNDSVEIRDNEGRNDATFSNTVKQ